MEIQKLVSKSTNLMFNYPQVGFSRKCKNLAKRILGRDVYVPNCIGWPNGLCALGLLEQIRLNPSCALAKRDIRNLQSYFDNWIRRGAKISRVEDFISGYVLMELMDVTEHNSESVNPEYEKAVQSMYEYLLTARKDEQGSLVYNPNQEENYIFADMIGMVCPFLAKYGVKYNKPEAIEMAMAQIDAFLTNSVDPVTKLPYHCYEYRNGEIVKLGIIGWGRAVGWIMMGVYGMCRELPDAFSLKQYLLEMAELIGKYQNDNGLFGWKLSEETVPGDTSATAMILYSLNEIRNNEGIKDMFDKALNGLMMYITDKGEVLQAQAECLGMGMHPDKYGSYPWSVGTTLALLSVISDSGN